jgi:hypothetical protein
MEKTRRINLIQFVRKKQSKKFLITFAAYFFVIIVIMLYLVKTFGQRNGVQPVKQEQKTPLEIRGVEIIVNDSVPIN